MISIAPLSLRPWMVWPTMFSGDGRFWFMKGLLLSEIGCLWRPPLGEGCYFKMRRIPWGKSHIQSQWWAGKQYEEKPIIQKFLYKAFCECTLGWYSATIFLSMFESLFASDARFTLWKSSQYRDFIDFVKSLYSGKIWRIFPTNLYTLKFQKWKFPKKGKERLRSFTAGNWFQLPVELKNRKGNKNSIVK